MRSSAIRLAARRPPPGGPSRGLLLRTDSKFLPRLSLHSHARPPCRPTSPRPAPLPPSPSASPQLPPPPRKLAVAAVREFHYAPPLRHKEVQKPAPGQGLQVNYITPEGEKITVYANEGDNLLDLAHANDIDLEGACEGSLACSTCHVIVEDTYYDKLDEPSDEENDMLDLAFGLTETSRLGCQVVMTKDLDGITVRLPSATRNLQVEKMR